MPKKRLVLVTPALAAANNGNWQTARRWARMLGREHPVHLASHWGGGDEALMIALHARRSAASIAAWRAAHPQRPLVVVLTGTDLYRDNDVDADAQRSLALADRLVVLNELGARRLPEAWRAKTVVVLQSSPPRQPLAASGARRLRAVMVGHLRPEKRPQDFMEAARRLVHRADLRLDHIGGALEPELAEAARATMAGCPNYRWLGGLPHEATRQRIQRAQVLVNASAMEGGAQVVVEAITSGVPVLLSRIDGHLGLVGEDYPGTFAAGDVAALAALLIRCRDDPAMLPALRRACAVQAPRFAPQTEHAAIRGLVASLLETPP